MTTKPFSELVERGYQRWYEFGKRSPEILYRRLRRKYPVVFRTRMAWQRATRGYSDDQFWNLNTAVATLIVAGVRNMRKWAHGYPAALGEEDGAERWDAILAQIEEGFQAWLDEDGWFNEGSSEAEVKFKVGMNLFAEWFAALWD